MEKLILTPKILKQAAEMGFEFKNLNFRHLKFDLVEFFHKRKEDLEISFKEIHAIGSFKHGRQTIKFGSFVKKGRLIDYNFFKGVKNIVVYHGDSIDIEDGVVKRLVFLEKINPE
jgi:hypothetical protein